MKTKCSLLLIVMLMAQGFVTFAQTAVPDATPPQTTATTSTNTPGTNEVEDLVSFDVTPLPEAIQALAQEAGLNIEMDPRLSNPIDAEGKPIAPPNVTEKWKNVTARQALQVLLDTFGWQIEEIPNNPIVRISRKDPKALPPLTTTVIPLNYSEPTNISVLVKSILSDRSSVQYDLRTHALVLRTTDAELPSAKELIARLDTATREVLIEAKIIETTKAITSAKGVDWTGTLAGQHLSFGNGLTAGTVNSGSTTGSAAAGTTTAPGGRTVGGAGALSTVTSNATAFVTTITGSTGSAGGFSANTASGINPSTFFLNADGVSAVLAFLNTDADTKTVAFPRTVSMDGVSNQLVVVQNVPVFEQQQSTGAPGTANLATVKPNYNLNVGGTILNEVGVKLGVTPRIAGPSNVLLTLDPEISKVDALIATDTLGGQVNTSPIFDRRRITTQAMVPSSYTLVLGGLDNDLTSKTYTKVPLLGDIPGLGYLFRSDSKDNTLDSILIFVTPTIVQDTDFKPTDTRFLNAKNEDLPPIKDTLWDSGTPYDWTKPQGVSPVYKP